VRRRFRVAIIGAGKVGTGLGRAFRAAGAMVLLRAARSKLPRKPFDADLLILAVHDEQMDGLVRDLLAKRAVAKATSVVHCSGALGPEPLAPLRAVSAGVAQMHPMISFASRQVVPTLTHGQVNVDGDPRAVRVAIRAARLLGMSPRSLPEVDKTTYHAAAALTANGAAALAGAAAGLLEKAGVSTRIAAKMLGPLLRSVADNVERLGLPDALTGPVRRGNPKSVARHLDVIRTRAPDLVPLYRALVLAQLPLARKIGDGQARGFDAIEALFDG
jgi:predicted short-subunit dehydrogenase-like oxidoreductase (DUF2520 family)